MQDIQYDRMQPAKTLGDGVPITRATTIHWQERVIEGLKATLPLSGARQKAISSCYSKHSAADREVHHAQSDPSVGFSIIKPPRGIELGKVSLIAVHHLTSGRTAENPPSIDQT